MTEENGIVDSYLVGLPDKPRESGVYYTTDISKGCLRQAYYDIVSPRRFDAGTLRIFEVGRMIEDLVVRSIGASGGYSVVGTQVAARWPISGGSIHGRVDVLAEDAMGRVVFEVKSIKNFYYLDAPKPEHVAQLNFYLNVLGLEFGEVFYVSKEALLNGGAGGVVEKRFRVRRDPVAFEVAVRRAELLHAAVSCGVAPDASPCYLCNGYCGHVECENCVKK